MTRTTSTRTFPRTRTISTRSMKTTRTMRTTRGVETMGLLGLSPNRKTTIVVTRATAETTPNVSPTS